MAMHWCHRSRTNPCWLHLSPYLSPKYNRFGNYGLFPEMLDIPVLKHDLFLEHIGVVEAVTHIHWKSTFFMSVSWIYCLNTLSILFAVTVDFSLAIPIYTSGELRFKKHGDLECEWNYNYDRVRHQGGNNPCSHAKPSAETKGRLLCSCWDRAEPSAC